MILDKDSIPKEEWELWRDKTRLMILETELVDNQFRKDNPNHKCRTWYQHEPGKWFCDCLVANRKKNKKLQKGWKDNIKQSPMLQTKDMEDLARDMELIE